MSKFFKVRAEMTSDLQLVIKAENKEEAWKKAEDADGGDFEEVMNGWPSGDFNISDITEITKDEAEKGVSNE